MLCGNVSLERGGFFLNLSHEQILLSDFCIRRDHQRLLHPHPFNVNAPHILPHVISVFSKVESPSLLKFSGRIWSISLLSFVTFLYTSGYF